MIARYIGISMLVAGLLAPRAQAATDAVETIDVADAEVKEGKDWFSDAYPVFDRILDLPTGMILHRGDWGTIVQHRAYEGALQHPFDDLLGFDPGGLKIGLGVRYGVLDWLDVGIYRINGTVEVFDTYEFDGRFQLLRQSKHKVDLMLRAGLSWFAAPTSNSAGGFGQLVASRLFFDRLIAGVGLLYHSSSTGPNKSNNDAHGSGAIMAEGEYRFNDNWSLAAEMVYGGIGGYGDTYPVLAIGPKYITNRHTFAFIYSNTQYVDAAGIVANTYRMGIKDWVLGFHITREI